MRREREVAGNMRSTVRVAELPLIAPVEGEDDDKLVVSRMDYRGVPSMGPWVRVETSSRGATILEIETRDGWRTRHSGFIVACGKRLPPQKLRWTTLRGERRELFVTRGEGVFDPVTCSARTDRRASVAAPAIVHDRSVFGYRARNLDDREDLVLVLPPTRKLAADGLREGDIVVNVAALVTMPIRAGMVRSVVAEIASDEVKSFRDGVGLPWRKHAPPLPASLLDFDLVQSPTDPTPTLFVTMRSSEGVEFPDTGPAEAASPQAPTPSVELLRHRDPRERRFGGRR